jgi:hypothetical protein
VSTVADLIDPAIRTRLAELMALAAEDEDEDGDG